MYPDRVATDRFENDPWWTQQFSGQLGNVDASTRNLQFMKEKLADQPAKKHVTPNCINVCPLLNHGNNFSKMYVYPWCFVQCY